jgi:hypothetical protein
MMRFATPIPETFLSTTAQGIEPLTGSKAQTMPNEARTQAVYFIENEGIIFRLKDGFRWKTAPSAAYHPGSESKATGGEVIDSFNHLDI